MDSSLPSGESLPTPTPTNMAAFRLSPPHENPPAPITPLSPYPRPSDLGSIQGCKHAISVCPPVNISTLRWEIDQSATCERNPYDNNGLNSGRWRGRGRGPGGVHLGSPPGQQEGGSWASGSLRGTQPYLGPWCRGKPWNSQRGTWGCQDGEGISLSSFNKMAYPWLSGDRYL